MRGLTDKAVLVSGGSSGIGKATVRRFLEEGGRVYFCGLDADEVRATVDELSSLGSVDVNAAARAESPIPSRSRRNASSSAAARERKAAR